MKEYLYGFCMCQSMFCAIPFPLGLWDEKARGKMLVFLPLVGLEIGALWAAVAWASEALELPLPLRALAVSAWPFLATGFLHLDGFMDVTDAVRSCRAPERRREILKDPHVGSFAVIGLALVLLAQFAGGLALPRGRAGALVLLPVVSRCCSALAVTVLRPMPTSQYAQGGADRSGRRWLTAALLLALALGAVTLGKEALSLLACVAGYGLALRRGYKSLEGMNGDIAGYSLTLGELAGLTVLCIV